MPKLLAPVAAGALTSASVTDYGLKTSEGAWLCERPYRTAGDLVGRPSNGEIP